jgi:hypothetical protein
MLEFLIDNIFAMCFSTDSRHTMGTNCAPLLADLFLYSYDADFIQGFLKKNEQKLVPSFNFTFRYILMRTVILSVVVLIGELKHDQGCYPVCCSTDW